LGRAGGYPPAPRCYPFALGLLLFTIVVTNHGNVRRSRYLRTRPLRLRFYGALLLCVVIAVNVLPSVQY
jgi:hypothetical protein